jgi:glucose-6-phosphate 1-dehydrogenase
MEKPQNLILVIFGASGDLTRRKLVPALYDLHKQNLLPDGFAILGVGRTQFSDDSFRNDMENEIKTFSNEGKLDNNLVKDFLLKLHYLSMNTKSGEDYALLKNKLSVLNSELNTKGNFIYYLAVPPDMYEIVTANLGKQELNVDSGNEGWKRVIVEKPFGYDLESAKTLNKKILEVFREDQIYRIDHYLGKETVQNLLVTRFSNGIFEPLWNRNYIHHVEVTSAESIGVENRGSYYDNSGALRDMVQNHLLQVTGLVAMEPPSSFQSNSIRNEVLKVFQSFRPIKNKDVSKYVIRGQYTASKIRGKNVPGYREEKNVNPDSRTETYVAIKFYIDNWRWGGVPFYIRTGKRLPTRVTEVVIHFRPTPHYLFAKKDIAESCNQMVIRIQPDEGILLKVGMKVPGAGFNVQNVNMDFHYSDLMNVYLPTAYERLLLDSMIGDSTLYARGDVVEEAWKFVDPIQKAWKKNPDMKIYGYPAGTWGPDVADDLIEEKTIKWRYPCKNLSNDGIYCEL